MVRPRKDGTPSAPCSRPEGQPRVYTEEWIDKEADEFMKWADMPNSIWIKDFALNRGYNPQRYEDFCKRSEKFAETYKVVKQKQESRLFKGALAKRFNQPMAELALKRFHGWKADTAETLNTELVEQYAAFMHQLTQLQSARKIADNNNKAEDIS